MATPPDSPAASFQVDCDETDTFYNELYKRAQESRTAEMQPLASMVVEVRMLPKDSTDTSQSK